MKQMLKNIKTNARTLYNGKTATVSLNKVWLKLIYDLCDRVDRLGDKNKAARAIMQKFVDKVDSGRARSTETYAEMKEWLDD